ncbi:MAG: PulJ/GspJ family protein [Campylobacterota bacterium]
MKKAFTLVEVLISVALLSIILVFLIKLLDNTKKTEEVFTTQATQLLKYEEFKELVSNDFFYNENTEDNKKTENLKIKKNSDDNHILNITTSNIFYDISFDKVSYILSKEGSLFRVESNKYINKKNSNLALLEKSYITKLIENVEYFRVSKVEKTDAYVVYLKTSQKEMMFTVMSGF